MRWYVLSAIVLFATLVNGCVSVYTYKETLAKLEESREKTSHTSMEFKTFKEDARTEIYALEQEQARLTRELLNAQQGMAQSQTDLQSVQYHFGNEQQDLRELEGDLVKAREAYAKLDRECSDLRWQRNLLRTKMESLEEQLKTTKGERDSEREAQAEAQFRIQVLEQEQRRLSNELIAAQSLASQVKNVLEDTEQDLVAEQLNRQEADRQWAVLRNQKQQLERMGSEIRRERDFLQSKVEDLIPRLDTLQEVLTTSRKSLTEAHTRIVNLAQERKEARAALDKVQKQARSLEAALSVEQEVWTRLQKALKKVEKEVGVNTRPSEGNHKP